MFLNNPWLLVLVTGVCFGFWPIAARASKLAPSFTGLAVITGTFMAVLISNLFFNRQPAGAPSTWIFPLMAGLINGIGFLACTRLATNPAWGTTYTNIGFIVMIAVIAIGGMLFLKELVTISKIAGLMLGILAIWLMTRT